MCQSNNKEILHNEVYTNIQTGEVLDWARVEGLKDNAMLKVKPELWCIWDFKKNDEFGFDIWEMTKGLSKKTWWYCVDYNDSYPMPVPKKVIGRGCSICSGHYVVKGNCLATNNPNLSSEWHTTLNLHLTPDDVTCGSNQKVWWHCNKGHEWDAIVADRNIGVGCPYCAGKKVLVGFNDMWTTNLRLASLLVNPEDGYEYTQSSNVKLDWKCPDCDTIIESKQINTIKARGLTCSLCSDSIPQTEKIMGELLKYLNVNFKHELSFKWSNNKRYDFFIPTLNMIIETHGEQHYIQSRRKGSRSLEDERTNDKYKYNLATENGIKDYIVIDCRKSDFEFIKNNILNSKLAEIFNLSKVDWDKIEINVSKSMHIEFLNFWNIGMSSTDISDITGFHKRTISKTLKKFDEMGMCIYDSNRQRIRSNKKLIKPIYQFDVDMNFIREWDSASEISDSLNFSKSMIYQCCNGKLKTANGFKWRYKEYCDKYIEEHNKLG